jgi:hypothetical protein
LVFTGTTAFVLDSGTSFSGAGNLTKDGPTTLTLLGSSTALVGSTTVNSGTLLVNGSQPGSATTVKNGATLGGTGAVGAVVTTSGTVSPGDGPGVLTVRGNVTLDQNSTFIAELNGPTPGVGYDQLNVAGTVNLAGSTLSPSLGFTPSGQSFTIIRSNGPIVGTFKGLPEGAPLLIDNVPFTISYLGGNGKNVVLTLVGAVQPPQIISGGSATFTVGTAGSFTAASIGLPIPALSETGALPSGVTFLDNGDGSAELAGTAARGTGGIYHLKLTASNGQVPSASQNFTLTVKESPAVTSAAATQFVIGIARSFRITTTGFPTPTLTGTGKLPAGLTFVDNGDGTASLAGTAAAGAGGDYDLKIAAFNGVGGSATADLRLTVEAAPEPPVITSAGSTTFLAGRPGIFVVTTTGSPTPSISQTGALPQGMTFVNNGDGTATLAGTPTAGLARTFQVTFTAANGVGTAATQVFTIRIEFTSPPKVIRLQRIGDRGPTRIILWFDEPMDPARARLTSNYIVRRVVRGRALGGPRQAIRVSKAVYDATKLTVTLTTARRLSLKNVYQLAVNGEPPRGLANASGVLLDGNGNGLPGGNFIMSFRGRARFG